MEKIFLDRDWKFNETFTEDMMSFISGNLNNPRISYYENEKKKSNKNYIPW